MDRRKLTQSLKRETILDSSTINVIVKTTMRYYQHITFYTPGLKHKEFGKRLTDSIINALTK